MDKKRLIFSSGIANIFEWYDYALFGHFASLIGSKFFPDDDPKVSVLKAFLVFAVGYLMRPLGGVFFGILGDKVGRKAALSTAIICMAIPTALIGLLPTYQTIGITASILMVIMRMLQGLSMGGALTGSISFLIEHTESYKRGYVGSIPMASICLGILLGTIVAALTKFMLSYEQFDSWGWRFPFLIGIGIMFVGLYIRRHTDETPTFERNKALGNIPRSPLKLVLRSYWFDMIVSMMINSTGSVIFYFQAIYAINYLKLNRHFPEAEVDKLSVFCYLFMAIICIVVGKLSDIIGRRKIYIMIIMLVPPLTFNITYILQNGNWLEVITALIALAFLAGAYIGPEPALQAEFYPAEVRSTALSISYNMATSLFGGTTPYILAYLYQTTGSLSNCNYYVLIVSVISLVGLYFYKNRSKPIITEENL